MSLLSFGARLRKSVRQPRLYPPARWLPAALLIALCIATQLIMTLQGVATFDSDEAVFGLMARHILRGELPVYFYGQRYLGSLEALLSAVGIWLFGSSVVAMRLGALVLLAVFLVLHYVFVARVWDRTVALLSLLFLAMPAPMVRLFTNRPITGLAIIFVLGATLLLLHLGQSRRATPTRLGIVGVIIGLGIWSHTMFSIYLLVLTVSFVLSTPEWATIYAAADRWSRRRLRVPARWWTPLLALGAGALGVAAVFSGGCALVQQLPLVQTGARVALALGAALVVALLVRASARRAALAYGALCLAGGFIVGNAPQWYAWLAQGVAPKQPVEPSCLTEAGGRVDLVLTSFIPNIWGIMRVAAVRAAPLAVQALWGLAALITVAALLVWLAVHRRTLVKLVTFAPLAQEERGPACVTLLWALPFVLAALSSNTLDERSLRYVLLAWPSGAVMLALLLRRVGRRSVAASAMLAVFWIGTVGTPNMLDRSLGVSPYRNVYQPDSIAALETFLRQNNVTIGYSDYWLAYTITFITAERVTLVPYNDAHLYPPYVQQIGQASVRAYVFPKAYINQKYRLKDFKKQVRSHQQEWDIRSDAMKPLRHGTVIKRRTIGDLDVWLVAE